MKWEQGMIIGIFLFIIVISGYFVFFNKDAESWQCIEWKNETSIVYKGYIYGSKNSTWEEISKLIPIDFGFYKNEEGYMEKGRLVLFEEDFVTNNIKIYWYVFESQPNQVCVKEGKNCKENFVGYPEKWHHSNGSSFITIHYSFDYIRPKHSSTEALAKFEISNYQRLYDEGWRSVLDFQNPISETFCEEYRDLR